ncbi:hypothetical protein [Paenibacillus lautus]|uniref:hypothetical protein n=2 Tax=Paenibacillus TaxID=44249 RepID=UPI0039888652
MVDQSDSRQLTTKSRGTTTWPENVISCSDHFISRSSRISVNDAYGVSGLGRSSSAANSDVKGAVNMNEEEYKHLGVFRGIFNGMLISLPLWALIVWAIIGFR